MCWRLGQTYSFMQISTSLDLRQTEAVQFIKDLSKKQNAPALAQLASCIASAMKLSHGDDVFAKITDMKSAFAAQPVSIAIQTDQSSFQSYKSGVLSSGYGTLLDHGYGYAPKSGHGWR